MDLRLPRDCPGSTWQRSEMAKVRTMLKTAKKLERLIREAEYGSATLESRQQTSSKPPLPHPPLTSTSASCAQQNQDSDPSLGLGDLSLIDRARALCAAADDVQQATIEASRRIAALHGSPDRRKTRKAIVSKPAKPPPDICARPPSDVPPPRGQGWRRIGPVSVVRGSNRISAPPQSRRALTRGVEVFVDGDRYCVVPADIDPGGGFCVSIDRDFQGDTNMACMLYLRKKDTGVIPVVPETIVACDRVSRYDTAAPSQRQQDRAAAAGQTPPVTYHDGNHDRLPICPSRKMKSPVASEPTPSQGTALAPFGSVGQTNTDTTKTSSRSPSSGGIDLPSGLFMQSQPRDREHDGSDSIVAVREAQRRARRRAALQRNRDFLGEEEKTKALRYARTPPTAADLERLHASRRAALARVTAQKQKVVSKRQRAERDATEEKRRRDAEACAREDASRAAAVARAEVAAAEKRQRHREAEMVRQTEMNVKRERVAAVLAYDERKADEKEKRVRNDTYRRIQREEKRRELVLQRQEDERMEKIRLHEAGQRYAASTAGVGVGAFRADSVANPARTPAARSARSFFSVAGSTSMSETVDRDNVPVTTPSISSRTFVGGARRHRRVAHGHGDDRHDGQEEHTQGQDIPRDRRAHNRKALTMLEGDVVPEAEVQAAAAAPAATVTANRPPQIDQRAEPRPIRRADRATAPNAVGRDIVAAQGDQVNSHTGSAASLPASCLPPDSRSSGLSSSKNSRKSSSINDRPEGNTSRWRSADDSYSWVHRGFEVEKVRKITGKIVSAPLPVLDSSALASSSAGPGSASASGAASLGSGGNSGSNSTVRQKGDKPENRKRIAVTPVWKRPVVPLSKPYVPLPTKDDGRFSALLS